MPRENMWFIEGLINKIDCTTQQGVSAVKMLIGNWLSEYKASNSQDVDDALLSFVYRQWRDDNA